MIALSDALRSINTNVPIIFDTSEVPVISNIPPDLEVLHTLMIRVE
jgi:hypothetical protein